MPTRIEIPNFPQNKRLALTLSFDDGVTTDIPTLDFLNAHNLKATWNLNSGKFGQLHNSGVPHVQAADVPKIYAGHEVAIHTVTHPHLPDLAPSQIAAEVLDDRKALEDLVAYPVRGMAYPFGTYNPHVIQILRTLNIAYARTTENRNPCFPPEEPLAWPTTAHQFDPALPEKWQQAYANPEPTPQNHKKSRGVSPRKVNQAGPSRPTHIRSPNSVFFIWGHTYEFQTNNDWPALHRIFLPMAHKPDIWYCTNIELFDYETARKQIVIAANRASAYNPTAKTITLLTDGKPIDIPPGATIQL